MYLPLLLLLLLPGFIMVKGHHRQPKFCELRDSTNSLLDQKACGPGLDCIGGPIGAMIDGAFVDYYYCKIANSPVSNSVLTAYMLKKIVSTW